jgi:hypothetical protein
MGRKPDNHHPEQPQCDAKDGRYFCYRETERRFHGKTRFFHSFLSTKLLSTNLPRNF